VLFLYPFSDLIALWSGENIADISEVCFGDDGSLSGLSFRNGDGSGWGYTLDFMPSLTSTEEDLARAKARTIGEAERDMCAIYICL